MKIENARVMNIENALRGMRNPKNSWHLSDSVYGLCDANNLPEEAVPLYWQNQEDGTTLCEYAKVGPNDMKLAQNLIKAGPEHRKFLRQIFISFDITAPLFMLKEFDTYKVATVANSTSTMHTLMKKPITLDCFEIGDFVNIPYPEVMQRKEAKSNADSDFVQMHLIPYLEYLRQEWLRNSEIEGNEELCKVIWKELIRWLPESWLQTRTVTMNYETLRSIYHQRQNHKLVEWSVDFMDFIESLPYAKEFIMS